MSFFKCLKIIGIVLTFLNYPYLIIDKKINRSQSQLIKADAFNKKNQINRLLDENKKCPTIKSRKWDVLFGKVTFVCFGAEQFVVLAAVVVVLANRVALARITLKKKGGC